MPTVISHAVVGFSVGFALSSKEDLKFLLFSVLSSVFPDIDGISFFLGIPYSSFFGHRGFFHSIFFSLILSIFLVHVFFHIKAFTGKWFFYEGLGFGLSLLHSFLDAMTAGGKGVAFFSPFSNKRYLLPWRPMIASPVRISDFFSEWGKIVIINEIICLWIPSFFLILISLLK